MGVGMVEGMGVCSVCPATSSGPGGRPAGRRRPLGASRHGTSSMRRVRVGAGHRWTPTGALTAERPQGGSSSQGSSPLGEEDPSGISLVAGGGLVRSRGGGVDAEEASLIAACDVRHAQYLTAIRRIQEAVEGEDYEAARQFKEEAEAVRRADAAVGFAGALERAVAEERYDDAGRMQRDKRGRAVRELLGYWRAQGQGQGGVLDMRGKLVCVEAGMAHGRLVGSVVTPDGDRGAGSKVPVFEVFVKGDGDNGGGEASEEGFVVRSLVPGAATGAQEDLLVEGQRRNPGRHPTPVERRRSQVRRRRRDGYVLECGGAVARDTAGLRLPDVWVESDDVDEATRAGAGEMFSAAHAAGLARGPGPSYRARKGTTRPVGPMLCKRCRSTVADASGHALPSSARKARVDHLSKTAPSRPFLLRFKNGLGVETDILTMGQAIGAATSPQDDGPTTRFSWFKGYSHRPVYCNGCANHVGWRYTPEPEPERDEGAGGGSGRTMASGLLAAVGIGKRAKAKDEDSPPSVGMFGDGDENPEAFFGLLYDALVEDSGDSEGGTGLWQNTLLTRVPTPPVQVQKSSLALDVRDLEGLYVGLYGAHGNEIVSLACSDEGEMVATKITGDGNVPSGEVSFMVGLGADARLPHQGFFPEDWGVTGRFKGKGQVAGQGFSDPRWVEGELLLFSRTDAGPKQLNQVHPRGSDFGFLFNMGLERSLIVFSELPRGDFDITGKGHPLAIREDMPDLYLDLADAATFGRP